LKSPKKKHAILVARFFVSKFVLSTMDLVTDVLTAKTFFDNGNASLGLSTIVPIFAPFFARVILACIRVAQCYGIIKDKEMPLARRFSLKRNETVFKVQIQEMPKLVWDFPLFQPIRSGAMFNLGQSFVASFWNF